MQQSVCQSLSIAIGIVVSMFVNTIFEIVSKGCVFMCDQLLYLHTIMLPLGNLIPNKHTPLPLVLFMLLMITNNNTAVMIILGISFYSGNNLCNVIYFSNCSNTPHISTLCTTLKTWELSVSFFLFFISCILGLCLLLKEMEKRPSWIKYLGTLHLVYLNVIILILQNAVGL